MIKFFKLGRPQVIELHFLSMPAVLATCLGRSKEPPRVKKIASRVGRQGIGRVAPSRRKRAIREFDAARRKAPAPRSAKGGTIIL
jgi:hypothetical protein